MPKSKDERTTIEASVASMIGNQNGQLGRVRTNFHRTSCSGNEQCTFKLPTGLSADLLLLVRSGWVNWTSLWLVELLNLLGFSVTVGSHSLDVSTCLSRYALLYSKYLVHRKNLRRLFFELWKNSGCENSPGTGVTSVNRYSSSFVPTLHRANRTAGYLFPVWLKEEEEEEESLSDVLTCFWLGGLLTCGNWKHQLKWDTTHVPQSVCQSLSMIIASNYRRDRISEVVSRNEPKAELSERTLAARVRAGAYKRPAVRW